MSGERRAVITGASGGLGEATARLLDRQGWRLILVARGEDRLRAVAESLQDAHPLALDLTAEAAPRLVRTVVEELFEGGLDLLVNNAGASWRAAFGDPEGGYENVRRTMVLNFDAVVRLTEALLPILRDSAPSSIVNVASVAGRVARSRTGAYSASKFALAGWTDALHLEERDHGVHVGLVLPGFVATPGFPQTELKRRWFTRWTLSTPERVADAVLAAGPGGRAERLVPRPWALVILLRALMPALVRRLAHLFP